MARTNDRWLDAKPGSCTILLAALAIGLATALACSSGREPAPRFAFDVEVLDSLDAAMTRLAAGRWSSWTMGIQGGQLAFQIEAGEEHGEKAQRGDCFAIAKVVRENAGAQVPWHAEITRRGRLVKRCPETPLYGRHTGSKSDPAPSSS